MEIIAQNNKEISLIRFYQWKTYENLLCGLPTIEMNARLMDELKITAKEYFNIDAFYLIEPEQTLIPVERPYGKPSRLPEITCIAKFYYIDDFTALVIGWYQNDFSISIETDFLEKMKSVPWSEVCCEADWG